MKSILGIYGGSERFLTGSQIVGRSYSDKRRQYKLPG